MKIQNIEKRLLKAFETRRKIHLEKSKRIQIQEVIKSIFKEVYNENTQSTEGEIICKCGHTDWWHYNNSAECKKCKCKKFQQDTNNALNNNGGKK